MPLRCGVADGCRYGEPGREDLGPPLAAWYIGSDGEALDMLASHRDGYSAAVEGGLLGAMEVYRYFLSVYRIGAAQETNAKNSQGYHKKGARRSVGRGVVSCPKGHLDVDLSAQNVKAPALRQGSFGGDPRAWTRFHGFHIAKSSTQMLRRPAPMASCLQSV